MASVVQTDNIVGDSVLVSYGWKIINMPADANFAPLLSDLVENEYLQITSVALTALRELRLPTNNIGARRFIYNNSTGGFPLQVKAVGQVGVALPNGHGQTVWCDGVDWYAAGPSVPINTLRCRGRVPVSITADADFTVALADCMKGDLFDFTSTLAWTAQHKVIFPLVDGALIRVYNNISGAQPMQVISASGTGIVVATAKRALLECDGVNWIRLTADA